VITLTTLNARYIHSALGLRYLKANAGELRDSITIVEFIINTRPIDIAEQLLAANPTIIGFGIYIWNVEQSEQVIAIIRQVRPTIKIIIGGPEVSFEQTEQPICALADYVICGAADTAFATLCQALLDDNPPTDKIIQALPTPPIQLRLPYDLYNDEDIAHRVLYVEASRGCPFKCEFCLSALDKTATAFDTDRVLQALERLHQRGVRRFKFVDRTFNLNTATSLKILRFFLDRMSDGLFVHFEIIPDHLPERLRETIKAFPHGSLQFEIGIQSFNTDVQATISRKQNNEKSVENLTWLRNETSAHLHADLIIGLPGEDIDRFASSFNRLVALNPHDIQVGILKRLRGTPLIRHTDHYAMRYNPAPPYNILSTSTIDFTTMQRLSRFSRYWDLIMNCNRFNQTRPLLLGDDPFLTFMKLSDWLFLTTEQTYKISLKRLFGFLYQALTETLDVTAVEAEQALRIDYQNSGVKGLPPFP